MNETSSIVIYPIATAHSPLKQKFGTPRQPNIIENVTTIKLLPPYDTPLAVQGLAGFSHLWIIWQFNQVADHTFKPLIRPPRLGGNKKIGVFASRSMFRPNRLGLSVVRLHKVIIEDNKASLVVLGADFIDQTPIIDIKPYIAYSDVIDNAKSGYAPKKPTMIPVKWTSNADEAFNTCLQKYQQNLHDKLIAKDKNIISELVALDPRPAYKQTQSNLKQNVDKKTYKVRYKNVDVVFMQDDSNEDGKSFKIIDILTIK